MVSEISDRSDQGDSAKYSRIQPRGLDQVLSESAKLTRSKYSRSRPKFTRQSSLGRSILGVGQSSLGRSIHGVGQGHSAISVGLGQSDPGKAHSDSAMFDSAIPLVLGQGDSAEVFKDSAKGTRPSILGFGQGDSAKYSRIRQRGLGHVVSAILFGQPIRIRLAHSDSARIIRIRPV